MPTLPPGRLWKLAVVAASLALVATACGNATATPGPTQGGASPAAQPSAAPTATATAAATAAATTGPGFTAAPATPAAVSSGGSPAPSPRPSFAIPSFTSDKELEATLPDAYKGVSLRKFSFVGPDLLTTANQNNADFLALLQALGKSPADLSFAVAADSTNTLGVSFGAFRIKGVDASAWMGTLWDLSQKENPGIVTADVNLGGKSVKRVTIPDSQQITYAWPRGEILFVVITTTDDLAADAIASRP